MLLVYVYFNVAFGGNDNLTPDFLYFEIAFGSITAFYIIVKKKQTLVSFVRLT